MNSACTKLTFSTASVVLNSSHCVLRHQMSELSREFQKVCKCEVDGLVYLPIQRLAT
jgi:hypothetical protein